MATTRTTHAVAREGAARAPRDTDPGAWDAYLAGAPTIVEAQDHMSEAAAAGVDFVVMLLASGGRR